MTKMKLEASEEETSVNCIQQVIDGYNQQLWDINRKIHANPELGYCEVQAHDNITSMLSSLGFEVTRHAYNLSTSFVAEYGTGGRLVVFNAEYDALPGIGHACGHNLIATASIGAFLGVAHALKKYNVPGRVRLLGTPAEEGLGGKIKLIDQGAYKDVDACLMVHPGAYPAEEGATGAAYVPYLANHKFSVTYTGRPAHAATAPWDGINALDAVVLAYNGISVLRQQMKPYERVHGVISDGGARPNIIPAQGKLEYYVRSATLKEANELKDRAIKCFEGAAMATGCSVEYEMHNTYADVRPNKTLSSLYSAAMGNLKSPVTCDFKTFTRSAASTDMGNVSYVCPGFHGTFGIPSEAGSYNHTPGFTAAVGSQEAHDLTMPTAKGMAIAGWKVLTSDEVAREVRLEFEKDQESIRLNTATVNSHVDVGCC